MSASQIRVILPTLLILPFLMAGCSGDSPPTSQATDGIGNFGGEIDPQTGKIVFKRLSVPVSQGAPVSVVLLGDNIETNEADEIVSIEVSIRNEDRRTLYGPAQVVVSDFMPRTVSLREPDWMDCGKSAAPEIAGSCAYGISYSGLLGDDDALSPGEESESRTWQFQVPELTGFTFGAMVQFSLDPDRPVIAGTFFSDRNKNGMFDLDEEPVGGGSVYVTGPGLEPVAVLAGPDGAYEIAVESPGLYTLFATAPSAYGSAGFTTPNPLEVILPEGPDGVQSVLHAHFGLESDVIEGACSDFNSGTLQGWQYQAAFASVVSPSFDGTPFMLCRDHSSPPRSAVWAPAGFLGDWSNVGELNFDVILYNDGWELETRPLFTAVQIVTGPIVDTGIRGAFVLDKRITDSNGDAPGWHHITVPIHKVDALPLPGNDLGRWVIREPNADALAEWNELVENVNVLYFVTDIVSSPSLEELFGLDNICLEEPPVND